MSKPNAKILIVDDSLVARRMVVGHLKQLGYSQVVAVASGEEAIERLQESLDQNALFDLIITDLRMPTIPGADFIAKIRQHPEFKSIPALIVSVETDRGTILDAVTKGADGYLLKPMTMEALQAKLEKIWSKGKSAS